MGGGTIDMFLAQLFGFFEAFFLEGNGADFTKEAKLAKANRAVGKGAVFDTADDGQSDGQIDPRFVDGQAAGDIDENILGPEREFEMFGQNGADELKAIGGDALGDAARNGDGAFDDQGLNFGGHGASAFHHQCQNRAGSTFEATVK